MRKNGIEKLKKAKYRALPQDPSNIDYMMHLLVQYKHVIEALPRVHRVLRPTLLRSWPLLNKLLGFEFYLKHENHLPVGAFKVRGGINLVGQLTEKERSNGLVAVSTGNHGQSLAYAKFEQKNPNKKMPTKMWGT